MKNPFKTAIKKVKNVVGGARPGAPAILTMTQGE
jgi:hypothetical protein